MDVLLGAFQNQIFPSYRTSGESVSPDRQSFPDETLMRAFSRDDASPREENRCLPPQDIQQDSNPPERIEPLKTSDQFCKGPVDDLNALAGPYIVLPMNRAFIVTVLLQALHNARGNRRGCVPLHHQACDAIGAIHASPPVSR